MKHLRYVAWIDAAIAFLDAVLALGVGTGAAIAAWFAWDDGRESDALVLGGLGGGVALMLALGAVLFGLLARRFAAGRWRIPQTIAAVFLLASWPPLGLGLGAYTLWVCWVNPETRDRLAG